MADTKKQRMLELVELLNRARRAYEQEDTEIMSNYEYDRLVYNYWDWKGVGNNAWIQSHLNVGYEVERIAEVAA